MPSLDAILKKTKNVAEINFVRKPTLIATEDRPDSLVESGQSNHIETEEQPLAIREHSVSNELAMHEQDSFATDTTSNASSLISNQLVIKRPSEK